MVSVMTMHQSKGLEFPFVFVGHLGDNASPESTHELEDMFGVFPNLSGRNFTALSADMRAELDTVRKYYVAYSRAEYARSEEHTSELQSLMRISYAVFCLTKKTQTMNK